MAISLVGMKNALLMNIQAISGENDSQLKLTDAGFLKLLLANNAVTEINNADAVRAGQEQEFKLRYLQRGLDSEVTSVDNCETPLKPNWKTTTISRPLYSKIGVSITDTEFRQWEKEAVETLNAGAGNATLMRGLYDVLLTKIIPLVSKIDSNLVTAQASKWGTNVAYGSSSAQSIALGTTLGLSDGIVKLQEDAYLNEISGNLLVCGNGLLTRYNLFNAIKGGNDALGVGALPIKAYNDVRTISAWGANHFGVFAPGTIGFVDFNKYVGAYAGEKGGSVFFTLPVPVEIDGQLSTLVFDAQLKYNDCPTYDAEGELVSDRGWGIILSKSYGLYNMPNDTFAATDRMNGFNGSLHYLATEKAYDFKTNCCD